MATYSIRPIALREGPRDASQYTYFMNFGTACKSACYAWYIEGSQPKTLVDAGSTASKSIVGSERDLVSIEDGLNKLGLKTDDIENIIITHLHIDHIQLGHLYKKAKFIVQKRELDYARNPHAIDAYIYDKSMFEGLNLEVIDGSSEIIPGVSVFLTPGHSPGGQSVKINTAAGKVIITGFCCHLSTFVQTEAVKRKGWEVTAPLIHHDVRQAYDSVLKVKQQADIILALHDPEYIGKEVIP
ncbi:N-acyl homoserine lactonase family protein [Chloroflexota bacterium]